MTPTIDTQAEAEDDPGAVARRPCPRVPLDAGEAEALAAIAARWRALGRESEARGVEEAMVLGKPRRLAARFLDACEGILASAERAAALRDGRAPPVAPRRVRCWWGEGGVPVESDHERRAVMLVPEAVSSAIEAAMQAIVDEMARRGYPSPGEIGSHNADRETRALRRRYSEIAGGAYRLAKGLLAATRGGGDAAEARIGEDLRRLEDDLGHALDVDAAMLVPPRQGELFDRDASSRPAARTAGSWTGYRTARYIE
jgi:hypothetical protein